MAAMGACCQKSFNASITFLVDTPLPSLPFFPFSPHSLFFLLLNPATGTRGAL